MYIFREIPKQLMIDSFPFNMYIRVFLRFEFQFEHSKKFDLLNHNYIFQNFHKNNQRGRISDFQYPFPESKIS